MRMLSFSLPTKVVVGKQALRELGGVLGVWGFSSAALFTDEIVEKIVGREVAQELEDTGFNVTVHLVGPATQEEFEKGRNLLKEVKADVVIGLGGGRVIDAAKYAAHFENKPFISAPTAVSHDGIASPSISFKDEEGKPCSIFSKPPLAVIADIDVISKAPFRLLASGFADLMSKVTSVRDALLAYKLGKEEVSLYALELAKTSLKIALKYAENIARRDSLGIKMLALAAITSGMSMAVNGSSRPASGSEHLFSHALDIVYPEKRSLHGEQVGVGTIMMAYLHGLNWRKVREKLQLVGAPVNAEQLGVPPEIIVKALVIAPEVRARYTILGDKRLPEEAARRLAKNTMVI